MPPITQDKQREIVKDFARAIRERKTDTAKPAYDVINFRDDKLRSKERKIEIVPIDLLRYRKDNGRIASDVMNYEKLNGPLDEKDKDAQEVLRKFLEDKHPEMTDILIKSIEHSGQNEPAIITCDDFLINGNRRKMALEHLRKHNPGKVEYETMKAVILPGPGDEGGPPTLLEIERLENRYQLQSEGKSEYYGFDRALSIKRKMDLGFTLEEQLRDDPRYAGATKQELDKAVKECDFINRPATLVYLDPPYLADRKGGYEHDQNSEEYHERLLKVAIRAKCMLFISGYESDLYNDYLTHARGWHERRFKTTTRGHNGKDSEREEIIWHNQQYWHAMKSGRIALHLSAKEKRYRKINPER